MTESSMNEVLQEIAQDLDDRWTPDSLFLPWYETYRFTIDVAASAQNAKLSRFYTKEDNALTKSWANERVWCNPPYSRILPWVAKAHAEFLHGYAATAMLLPANRTEQPWWQESQRASALRATVGRPTEIWMRARYVGVLMTYEEYWKGRAQLERPRFKNYGVLCEVHHGEYGALQKKLALAIICTRMRREADVCAMPGCGQPSEAQVVAEGEWWCAAHAETMGGAL